MREDYAAIYGKMHRGNKWFLGYSICSYHGRIAALIDETHSKSLLDYGCGKGLQYLERRIHEKWGGILPRCYDIGAPGLARRPEGKFDGVLCCDVMEHIAEPDVDTVFADVIGFANKFVFFSIGCFESRGSKTMPDGRNVHLTIKPEKWWRRKIEGHVRPELIIETHFDRRVRTG